MNKINNKVAEIVTYKQKIQRKIQKISQSKRS